MQWLANQNYSHVRAYTVPAVSNSYVLFSMLIKMAWLTMAWLKMVIYNPDKNIFAIYSILMQVSDVSEPSQGSTMELFAKIVKGFQPLTIFTKTLIIDAWLIFLNVFQNLFTQVKLNLISGIKNLVGIWNFWHFKSIQKYLVKITLCISVPAASRIFELLKI